MTAASPLRPEGTMSEPWHGSRPPDELVTLTLPYRTAKRVLVAVVSDAQRQLHLGVDPIGVELLATASDVIGDAVDAPVNRRFLRPSSIYPRRVSNTSGIVYHAVIAGTTGEFKRWLASHDGQIAALKARSTGTPVAYVASVDRGREMAYSGYTTIGTWEQRDDAQQLLATVRGRTFRSE